MQITVTGRQIDLSDHLRNRVWDQLNAIDRRYFGRESLITQVTFSRRRGLFVCEITVRAARLHLRSEAGADDAYLAFGHALAPIASRLVEMRARRYKRRSTVSDDDTALRIWMTDEDFAKDDLP